jgi:tRNA(fMet)-specific endonuclease VapC
MAVFILDTTTLTHLQRGHPRVIAALTAHAGDTIAVTTVNVEEMLGGWYDQMRKVKTHVDEARASQLLADATTFLAKFPIFPLTVAALDRYDQLRRLRLNVGKRDLKIAAVALELGAVVVTDNAVDFRRVPGLVWEDWTS